MRIISKFYMYVYTYYKHELCVNSVAGGGGVPIKHDVGELCSSNSSSLMSGMASLHGATIIS